MEFAARLSVLAQRSAPLLAAAALAACNGGGGSSIAPTAGFGPFQFDLRSDVSVANAGLIDAALVDLDGDGLVDLVETDYDDRTLAIGLGRSDGGFSPLQFLAMPGMPWTLASGDWDGDSRPDIAVACHAGAPGDVNAVAVYTQPIPLHFVESQVLALPDLPFDVASAALLGNGRDQLLVTLHGQRRTWGLDLVSPGQLAQFAELDSVPLGSGQQLALEALDLDADGDLDVLASETDAGPGYTDRVVLWRQTGIGTFGAPEELVAGLARPLLGRTGDPDGNGWPDLAVAQLDAPEALLISVLPGGTPAITSQSMGHGASSALFADLDGDGFPELATTQWKRQALALRIGTGPGQWGELVHYNVGSAPRGATAVMLPGDDRLDIACVNIGDVSLLYNDGGGEFIAARGYELGCQPAVLLALDLDADGRVDVVSVDRFQDQVVVMRGLPGGAFALAQSIALEPSGEESSACVAAGDFDGDLKPDLLVTLRGSDEVRLFRNLGSLDFESSGAETSAPVGDGPLGVAALDVDGDERLDAVVANASDRSYQVLLGDGAGGFVPQPAVALDDRPMAVYLGDLDGDARADLVLSAGEEDGSLNRVLVLSGEGGGAFELRQVLSLAGPAANLVPADFDGDGRTDLVASQGTDQSQAITVLRNLGDCAFSALSVPVGFNPASVGIGDLDEDGNPDLLCPLGHGALRIALGDGAGGFPVLLPPDGSGVELPVPFDTLASAFVDADLDGIADVLMVSPATPLLWVARNRTVLP